MVSATVPDAPLAGELLRNDERADRGSLRPGGERLLRRLVLNGLPAESLAAAALLVVALDAPRGEGGEDVTPDLLASRQRVSAERAPLK